MMYIIYKALLVRLASIHMTHAYFTHIDVLFFDVVMEASIILAYMICNKIQLFFSYKTTIPLFLYTMLLALKCVANSNVR